MRIYWRKIYRKI